MVHIPSPGREDCESLTVTTTDIRLLILVVTFVCALRITFSQFSQWIMLQLRWSHCHNCLPLVINCSVDMYYFHGNCQGWTQRLKWPVDTAWGSAGCLGFKTKMMFSHWVYVCWRLGEASEYSSAGLQARF